MKTKILFAAALLSLASFCLAANLDGQLDSVITNYGISQTKTVYVRNAQGNVVEETLLTGSTDGWKQSSKREYEYNEDGKPTSLIDYTWNSETNVWTYERKSIYTYNDSENQEVRITYNWDNGSTTWKKYVEYKLQYTYDVDGKMLNYVQSVKSATDTWVNLLKYDYTYNSSGQLVLKRNYAWDADNSMWNVGGKREYTYDSKGNNILEIVYDWDKASESWKPNTKYEMTYSQHGKLHTEIVSLLSNVNSWIEISKSTYYYHGEQTAIFNVDVPADLQTTKLLRNGQLFIQRGDKTYTVTGQEIK